jgi:HSP20 family protein
MFRISPVSSFNRVNLGSFMDDFFVPEAFRIDIKKENNTYQLVAELPGFKKEDIQISYEKEVLTIQAHQNQGASEEEGSYLYQERRHRSLKRSIHLSDGDETAIKAKLKDGLLVIEVPIQVSVASNIQIETES